MKRAYHVLDVFTDKPLSGNPLAVVHDCDGLDGTAMQSIAKEFNLSETVFVLPAENPAHTAKVRIFTPGKEVPFAGHPTVGTAIILARKRWGTGEDADGGERDGIVVLEEKIGIVRIGVTLKNGSAFAEFDIPQKPSVLERAIDTELAAAALGLVPAEIGFENHRPSSFTAGLDFDFVPVRDLGVLKRCKLERRTFDKAFAAKAAYVYTRETYSTGNDFHARMFAPGFGVEEDPATGSAAAAFAGVIRQFDQPLGGIHRYRIEQGHIMGRASQIGLEIDVQGDLHAVRIGGDAVVVAEGTLDV
ncbi:PhzF family phenazine biosynthesis protein [Microbaculum marinum]|uniref:PhzF family phenazine biosynthesis protein n=1 Tax=Microbaculum marinum TaxID=1764581 RepID=A0AAW9RZI5_9HYPH